MESVYDVQQLLKKFGTYIYTGDRLGDLELMNIEINDLFKSGMIQMNEYQKAKLILKKEILLQFKKDDNDGKSDLGN